MLEIKNEEKLKLITLAYTQLNTLEKKLTPNSTNSLI